ncbi:hypothetical protein Htur_4607 (plasmid) [Haloterrigena turkmenica DSM 5511]|uniref:Uncharacterized protein n=1 Tax=Haloterrigena turkmenica (strain ATCC 51198 / DSM 5511 / JCM 9101 / NCIMB 13204 / VKM B-1734 / 4k) TaxID=543526 RepID=D2S1Z8_HALTV|nr:hypothetical protein [Haloterrigena turkmenica]ADB63395.1 hypothetical protein Htur_4607 [Haloterrigena turkmenica DSM 5511]
MEDASVDRIQSLQQSISEWVHIGLRLVLVALVAKSALSKFVTHENSVSFFDAVGMPAPQLMVIVKQQQEQISDLEEPVSEQQETISDPEETVAEGVRPGLRTTEPPSLYRYSGELIGYLYECQPENGHSSKGGNEIGTTRSSHHPFLLIAIPEFSI